MCVSLVHPSVLYLTRFSDEKKVDGKDEEKIVGESAALCLVYVSHNHLALDDSDIQILKTYVRSVRTPEVRGAHSVIGSRSLCRTTQET